MRNITIMRPKRMEAGAMKLQVFVDGSKSGDLANGKEISLSVDENKHEINAHGGLLAGKGFGFSINIPSGQYSYTFQVDMVNAKNGYTPVLRPTDGSRLKDDVKVRTIIGAETTQVLLKDEIRQRLTSDSLIQPVLSDDKWQLVLNQNAQTSVLYEQSYSSTNVLGVVLGGIASAIDKMMYDTPEHKQETIDNLFDNYLKYLPDYEVIEQSIRFKG